MSPHGSRVGVLATARRAYRRELPPRYLSDNWSDPFQRDIARSLALGQAILDVGGGASPSVTPERRPSGVTYVGLDISADELERAPDGSYDEIVVADVTHPVPQLTGRFDLIVSWLVLEHVRPLDVALANMYGFLKPGGRLIAQAAGGRSLFGLANRALPHAIARRLLPRLTGRAPDTIFPAHYDRCTASALRELLDDGWEKADVRPLHTAVGYFLRSPLATAAYIAYEEVAYRRGRDDLASYYLITANRPLDPNSPSPTQEREREPRIVGKEEGLGQRDNDRVAEEARD